MKCKEKEEKRRQRKKWQSPHSFPSHFVHFVSSTNIQQTPHTTATFDQSPNTNKEEKKKKKREILIFGLSLNLWKNLSGSLWPKLKLYWFFRFVEVFFRSLRRVEYSVKFSVLKAQILSFDRKKGRLTKR